MAGALVPRWLNAEPSSDDDQTSSIYSESFTVTSGRSFDTLEDILSRFTIDFKPDYIVKLRNRMGPLIVGIDAAHNPGSKENGACLVLKPVNRQQWWRRLRLDSSGDVSLRSRKLRWWVFTLDLQGTVNPLRRTSDASFRLATKWDLSRGEYHNKRHIAMGDATEARVHWGVNYNLPEVAGSFGAARGRHVDRDMRAEVGYAHADVARVELVAWPWRNNPKWEGVERWNNNEGVDSGNSDGVVVVGGGGGKNGGSVASDGVAEDDGDGDDAHKEQQLVGRVQRCLTDVRSHVRQLTSNWG